MKSPAGKALGPSSPIFATSWAARSLWGSSRGGEMRGLAWGSRAGGISETAALERGKRPCHAKSSLFIITIIRNVHIPAKPVGHTVTKEPATLEQEGSGPFQHVGSNSWYREVVQ